MLKIFKPKRVTILGQEFSEFVAKEIIKSALNVMQEVAILKSGQGSSPNEIEEASIRAGVSFIKASVKLKGKV